MLSEKTIKQAPIREPHLRVIKSPLRTEEKLFSAKALKHWNSLSKLKRIKILDDIEMNRIGLYVFTPNVDSIRVDDSLENVMVLLTRAFSDYLEWRVNAKL